ncbi:MAG: hypothetical protein DRR19_26195 [Candidatus Parabeggiatoa sp. nov. 1]|nr:MAG: hypothetical protein DRR19_26195 [Gammaproteobacteria bacterium]
MTLRRLAFSDENAQLPKTTRHPWLAANFQVFCTHQGLFLAHLKNGGQQKDVTQPTLLFIYIIML